MKGGTLGEAAGGEDGAKNVSWGELILAPGGGGDTKGEHLEGKKA